MGNIAKNTSTKFRTSILRHLDNRLFNRWLIMSCLTYVLVLLYSLKLFVFVQLAHTNVASFGFGCCFLYTVTILIICSMYY